MTRACKLSGMWSRSIRGRRRLRDHIGSTIQRLFAEIISKVAATLYTNCASYQTKAWTQHTCGFQPFYCQLASGTRLQVHDSISFYLVPRQEVVTGLLQTCASVHRCRTNEAFGCEICSCNHCSAEMRHSMYWVDLYCSASDE